MTRNCAETMSRHSFIFFLNDVAFSPAAMGRNERLEAREVCCQVATILYAVVVPAVLSKEIAHPWHGRQQRQSQYLNNARLYQS